MALVLPDINGSSGTWGTILNDALNGMDTRLTTATNTGNTNTSNISTLTSTVNGHTSTISGLDSRIDNLEYPPAVARTTDGADQTDFNSTTYIAGSPQCGVSFVAPTSGNVLILFGARAQTNSVGNRVHVSVGVRTGSTIGSGSVILAPSDECAVETCQPTTTTTAGDNSRVQASRHRVCTGLSPGSTYNARVEHKTSISALGTIFYRDIDVIPI